MTQVSTTIRRARTARNSLRPYGRPYRRHLLRGALATVALVAARLAFPWPLRGLLEIVVQPTSSGRGQTVADLVPSSGDPVHWLVGAFAAIIMIWAIAEHLQRMEFTRYPVGLVGDVQSTALRRLPKAVRSGKAPGELIATVISDAYRLRSGMKSVLIGTTRNGLFFIGVTVIVMLINPVIGLVFLVGGVATMVAAGVGAWLSSSVIRRSREREGELTEALHQFFAGQSEAPIGKASRDVPDSGSTRIEGRTTVVVHAILGISTVIILLLTMEAGQRGSMSPGAVFLVLAYVLLMHNKTVGLGRSVVRMGRVLPSAERLAKLAKRKPKTRSTKVRATDVPLDDVLPAS